MLVVVVRWRRHEPREGREQSPLVIPAGDALIVVGEDEVQEHVPQLARLRSIDLVDAFLERPRISERCCPLRLG